MEGKLSALAATITDPAAHDPGDAPIAISAGLADWMLAERISLAFTSYQTGQLIVAGVGPDMRMSFNQQNYARATGLCYDRGRLLVGSMFQIWRLENMLRPGQYANNAFDMALVPRTAHTVGYVDTHELAFDADDRIVFVNSRYSCLATIDEVHSFRPIWKPRFISALAPEDRCHLNGMAMHHGRPRFVTMAALADEKDGWRTARMGGGVVMDVASGEVVVRGLTMPHSPRLHDGALWFLDSGRGFIVRTDLAGGHQEDVAFCPGFLRGLVFHEDFAVVTVSLGREGKFKDLAVQTGLEDRKLDAQCGVLIIDTRTGQTVHSILLGGAFTEMFDVAILPGVRNPMTVGPATVEMIGAVSIGDEA
ncbi:TIGR03032 family protein [Sphingopyxis sp. H050]|uniref:TIGR03032 family protein n=1 Tax=Sphingopyxis sp. H050 TaxID=1759072 RepID=UPI000AE5F4DA|nr:TIGR03032 family protein [Sphingopyxis sp. H050]